MLPFKTILVTGGCGFAGSSLALRFKRENPDCNILCLDNLKRRGSELNLNRLKAAGIAFIHGDIRVPADLVAAGKFDLLLECAAEPSVLAGYDSSPGYVVETNLTGTYNCLEVVRQHGAALCFLSTSRVYPHGAIEKLAYTQTKTRYAFLPAQGTPGAGAHGISELFPLHGPRSLYGATKLASELLIHEYVDMYGIRAIINRCGVLTGAGQFGKTDQGFMALWAARHFWRGPLSYIGFGGTGKQVRDVLHVDDLYRLLRLQLSEIDRHNGEVYNVGGGVANSLSLLELTQLCREITGNHIEIGSAPVQRPGDIRCYISDNRKVCGATGWQPEISPREIVTEIYEWIRENEKILEGVLK